ncbi:Uyr/REP helicase [Dasineura jujubifolia toursvirus 2a]|nr:Uyr/REP helicase [Dasineura jujubifolia toursvirus 2a]
MIPVKIAIIIVIIVLFFLLISRKFEGEKGTWDKKSDIEEYATIMKADTLDASSVTSDINTSIVEKVNLYKGLNNVSFNEVGLNKDEIRKSHNITKRSIDKRLPFTNNKPYRENNNESVGERICRDHIEKRFGKRFNKSRPDFLKNPITNTNLEIDCFSEELKLGIEYNGKQHYEFVPRFHKNKNDLYNQKYRDDIKRRLCYENGVDLIEVPYTVSPESIPLYIDSELQRIGRFSMV